MARKRNLPTPESIKVGKRIARARTNVEHTQETLAALMGVTPAVVAQYETGKTGLTAKRVDQLTRVLGVSMAWLLTGDDPEELVRAHTEFEREALALVRSLPADKQQSYLDLIKALAEAINK